MHTDIALAYLIKEKFVGIDVDIITPKEISNQRLKKNDINYVIGYDIINVINDDPPVKKFSGQKGLEKLDAIYRNKQNNIFPSYPFMSFLWDKKNASSEMGVFNILFKRPYMVIISFSLASIKLSILEIELSVSC